MCNSEEGCFVKLPSGIYVLQAKAMDFAGRKRVSRLRVALQSAAKLVLGKQIGETGTDTATVAVCDIAALGASIGDDTDRFDELITQHEYKDCGVVELRKKNLIAIPYVSTGFGDGSFPVFELKSGRRRVGMEFEFIAAGYKYGEDDDDTFVWPKEEVDCAHCGGTGDCYCLRKGPKTAVGCVRCGGSGKCRGCGGTGKTSR
jgi:hypothetical protein